MNLNKLIFIENTCYKAGMKIKANGIMVYSTGANKPYLKRFVVPYDRKLGKNSYNNHWNQPMDRQVCVHCFIGKLQDGTIATSQTFPLDHSGWHAGVAENNMHTSFEICEDDLLTARIKKKSIRKRRRFVLIFVSSIILIFWWMGSSSDTMKVIKEELLPITVIRDTGFKI